jgi:predicted RNase H-like HicB family nuclease
MNKLEYYLNLKYPFVLEQDDDGSYFIEYTDLPGCMSCGATIEEALLMGEDARKCWIESAIRDGDFIPEPKVDSAVVSLKRNDQQLNLEKYKTLPNHFPFNLELWMYHTLLT